MELKQIRQSQDCSHSTLRDFQGSYRKANLVMDYIRGQDVAEAFFSLEHMRNKWAVPVHKLLKAALNNAEQKNISGQMVIKHAFASKGKVLKRLEIKGRGRTGMRQKPYCHITLIIGKKEAGKDGTKS